MPSTETVWLVVLLDAVTIVAVALAAAYLFGFSGDSGDRVDGVAGGETDGDWRGEALALAGEARRTAARFDDPADPDRVARDLLPLAARIRRHERAAPAPGDREVCRLLFDLGVACQRVAVEHRPVGGPAGGYAYLEDRLEGLRADAGDLAARVGQVD